jgi:hypothetical protein
MGAPLRAQMVLTPWLLWPAKPRLYNCAPTLSLKIPT